MRQRWDGVSGKAGAGLICLALWMATACLLSGQERPAAGVENPPGSAQAGKRDFRFEAASVRAANPGSGGAPPATPGRFGSLTSIAGLAMTAFGKNYGYEIECPQWMASNYYRIDATFPPGATKADLPLMIQHLLEDRFGLVYHHETRQMAGYELVVAKSGARLAPSAGPVPAQSGGNDGIEFENGVPHFTKDAGSGELYVRAGAIWRGRNYTTADLAAHLANYLHAPVTDATGLHGAYDYTLTFTPQAQGVQGSVIAVGPAAPTLAEDRSPAFPLLRDALLEQLGLELRSVKHVSVDVVVLDSANKKPAEN